jgi:hypothetical protein
MTVSLAADMMNFLYNDRPPRDTSSLGSGAPSGSTGTGDNTSRNTESTASKK